MKNNLKRFKTIYFKIGAYLELSLFEITRVNCIYKGSVFGKNFISKQCRFRSDCS